MTTTHTSGARRALSLVAGLGLTLGSLAGCGISEVTGGDTEWLATCPEDAKLATSLHYDASGSSTTGELSDQDLVILRDAVGRTAACRGHLRVSAFAGSSAGTSELFDSELHLKGATDTARLRRIPALVDEVVEQVAADYRSLPEMTGGTDVVGQLRGDREYVEQLGEGYRLWSITVTDGFQTAGIRVRKLGDRGAAQEAAQTLPTVDFAGLGAEVLFVGIGTAARQVAPPTSVVEAVKAFYEVVCDRLSARSCRVATDYTPIGG